uniref:Uncharacterized protein LOC8271400 isoform X2 n=1 Tax=Rhizophora mucronata TaxID=61149 RepID=A0A2P2JLQ8_RHIMU
MRILLKSDTSDILFSMRTDTKSSTKKNEKETKKEGKKSEKVRNQSTSCPNLSSTQPLSILSDNCNTYVSAPVFFPDVAGINTRKEISQFQ